MAKKYSKKPELFPIEQRYNKLIKSVKKVLKLYNIEVKVEGLDNVPSTGNVFLLPNHKSYSDVLALIFALVSDKTENSVFRIPTFVAKKELESKMFLKHALKLIDTFTLDPKNFRESLTTMKDFTQFVKENKTYGVVFPEATRIKEVSLGEFKPGAFKAIQQVYGNIVPVAICNSLDSMNLKNGGTKKVITVKFLPEIKANSFITQEPASIAKRVKDLIEKEII
ncbi:lysophospholipid acyltransferase family protein [Mycoplasma leonicaptivi]|uniref:lysophospholipid acyltransferase family protein n=1 Tax=Mycoplasma leonicaptivi TaxID=36742 RepID=UPI001FDF5175|nr:lysophospholipid acyltransferase family protein [Mycoplasma leonicaptivi]